MQMPEQRLARVMLRKRCEGDDADFFHVTAEAVSHKAKATADSISVYRGVGRTPSGDRMVGGPHPGNLKCY
jgi:hypothetical protein